MLLLRRADEDFWGFTEWAEKEEEEAPSFASEDWQKEQKKKKKKLLLCHQRPMCFVLWEECQRVCQSICQQGLPPPPPLLLLLDKSNHDLLHEIWAFWCNTYQTLFFLNKNCKQGMGHHHDGAVVWHEWRLLKFGWWLCVMDDSSWRTFRYTHSQSTEIRSISKSDCLVVSRKPFEEEDSFRMCWNQMYQSMKQNMNLMELPWFLWKLSTLCSGTGRSKLGMVLTKSNVMSGVLLIGTEVWWGCSMQLQLHTQQNLKMKSARRFESFVPLFWLQLATSRTSIQKPPQ